MPSSAKITTTTTAQWQENVAELLRDAEALALRGSSTDERARLACRFLSRLWLALTPQAISASCRLSLALGQPMLAAPPAQLLLEDVADALATATTPADPVAMPELTRVIGHDAPPAPAPAPAPPTVPEGDDLGEPGDSITAPPQGEPERWYPAAAVELLLGADRAQLSRTRTRLREGRDWRRPRARGEGKAFYYSEHGVRRIAALRRSSITEEEIAEGLEALAE